jgi:hypothetical protein
MPISDPYKIETDPESLKNAIIELRKDFEAHNHDGVSSRAFETVRAESVASRAYSIKKFGFSDDTEGFWVGLVGSVVKFFLGSATNYIKWDGSRISIAGSISLTGIRSSTCFETAARFTQTVTGSGAVTFGNGGVAISPGVTGTSSAMNEWFTTQIIFANSPVFSTVLNLSNVDQANGVGSAYFGMGNVTVSGSGHTNFTTSHAGFKILKSGGVINLVATQADGNGGETVSSLTPSLNANDILDLVVKINGTSSIDYFYRKNSGPLTHLANLTTRVPTAVSNKSQFSSSNDGTAFNFEFIVISASYDR